MEFEHQKVNYEVYSIHLSVSPEEAVDELSIFRSILVKLTKQCKKAGFKKDFNIVERGLIEELYTNMIGEESTDQCVQQIGSSLTYVPDEE